MDIMEAYEYYLEVINVRSPEQEIVAAILTLAEVIKKKDE